jgi:hypothetical protein
MKFFLFTRHFKAVSIQVEQFPWQEEHIRLSGGCISEKY